LLKFKSAAETNQFFDKWGSFPELTRLHTLKELKANGTVAFVGKPTKEPFKCPLYHFPLLVPCSVGSCPYHVGCASSKNCVINSVESAKTTRLFPQEIAALLGTTVNQVNATLDQGAKKIQVALVRDKIDHMMVPKFKFLPGHCVSCGAHILDELGMHSELAIDDDFGWCSDRCKRAKPDWAFRIEHDFECDFLDVASVAYSMTRKAEQVDLITNAPAGTCKSRLADIEERLHDLAP